MNQPVRIVIVGMGQRSMIYARESLADPTLFKVVGVADTDPQRVRLAKETFGLSDACCFSSVEALCAAPRFADAAINGTMDRQHVRTTIPLLRAGYDVLLEKPFAINQREADMLLACAKETGRRVMVCHVLRYAPFYRAVKEIIASGEIGRVMHADMLAQISYFHESVSFVRGKYASPEICGSGLILSKCSHDLDLLSWLMQHDTPTGVSSVGSVFHYKPDMAPDGAGTRCLTDCLCERTCPYSAARLYIEHPQRWANILWFGQTPPSDEEKRRLLADGQNPYGRCVFKCGLQIVDHQSVLISYTSGATATFSVNGGASAPARSLHITGTKGELYGVFEDERFTVSLVAPAAPGGKVTRTVDVSAAQHGNAHGGGDQLVIRDFIALITEQPVSPCVTTLDGSVTGHRLAFLAEDSRLSGGQMQPY
ncbi:MAG: Gfo/Idh/MocA family oxidoreductase [Clostridia bacterium]|nr:Gfo/Idh/MocA family oxidoreductase [Clostridia bacterium]